MKRTWFALPVSLVFALLVGCSPTATTPSDASTDEVPELSVESGDSAAGDAESSTAEVATQQPAESSETILLDVRSQAEWDEGHHSASVHIPHTEVAQRIGEVTEDKQAKIVVYCAAGRRAGIAKTALEELGFTNVENGGGYDEIKEQYGE